MVKFILQINEALVGFLWVYKSKSGVSLQSALTLLLVPAAKRGIRLGLPRVFYLCQQRSAAQV